MHAKNRSLMSRRAFAGSLGTALLFAPPVVTAESADTVRRNVSSYRAHAWEDHFDTLGVGLIISDTSSQVSQHWTSEGEMRLYPTSIPISDELTRRGYTEVVEKRKNPSWAPTPSIRERNPEWPLRNPGGHPANPLGTRALDLSWKYCRSHGRQDTRKIGRRSSNGCIGHYDEHNEEVYYRVQVGTQVKPI